VYFADLTPYEYLKGNEPTVLNIGWLDTGHDFKRGEVPLGFLDRLRSLAEKPANQTRGFHLCPFCKNESDGTEVGLHTHIEQMVKVGAVSSAEIRVCRRDGRSYAAPILICHYIEAHGYQPPQEFIDAVMESY
jgi:hypothetical protein